MQILLFIALVGGCVAASVLLLRLFRHRVPHILTAEDHQLAGHFLGTMGGFYGVLLAFVVVMVWTQFDQANLVVAREANQNADLFRLSYSLPEPAQQRIRESLIRYDQVIVAKEWPAMASREESPEAWQALDDIWASYRSVRPQTPAEVQIYQISLARLADMSDARRLRLLASRAKVPGAFWALLIAGAVVTVFFTYLFRFKHQGAQLAMTAGIAGLIAFILFLIMDFDRPFGGIVRVRPEVFQRELQRMGVPIP